MDHDAESRTALIRPVSDDAEVEVQFQATSRDNVVNTTNLMSPVGEYEEFFGGTIQCPSCRGAGRIPRGD